MLLCSTSRSPSVVVHAVSRKTNRPARRRAHKLWRQQQQQEKRMLSMTQKQDVWYEVLQPEGQQPTNNRQNNSQNHSQNNSNDGLWVEHRRSEEEVEQFRLQQLQRRPTPRRKTAINDLLQTSEQLTQLGSSAPGQFVQPAAGAAAPPQWNMDHAQQEQAEQHSWQQPWQQPWQQQQQPWQQQHFNHAHWQQQQQQLQWQQSEQQAWQQQQQQPSQVPQWQQQQQQAILSSDRLLLELQALQDGSSSARISQLYHQPMAPGQQSRDRQLDGAALKHAWQQQRQQQQQQWQQQWQQPDQNPGSVQQPAEQWPGSLQQKQEQHMARNRGRQVGEEAVRSSHSEASSRQSETAAGAARDWTRLGQHAAVDEQDDLLLLDEEW